MDLTTPAAAKIYYTVLSPYTGASTIVPMEASFMSATNAYYAGYTKYLSPPSGVVNYAYNVAFIMSYSTS